MVPRPGAKAPFSIEQIFALHLYMLFFIASNYHFFFALLLCTFYKNGGFLLTVRQK